MKILIADDEPLARSRVRRIIEDMGQHDIVGVGVEDRLLVP